MDRGGQEERVLKTLHELGIPFERFSHPPVFTVEEASRHTGSLPGTHCKNLFLRNKKGNRHYLVVIEQGKRVDLKALNRILGEDRLSFASDERLKKYLSLLPGAVSPFGLINDGDHSVRVVVDSDLKTAGKIYFHPNVNTATFGIEGKDFLKFLDGTGNRIRFFSFTGETAVL